jgi:uncharacterized protein
VTGSEHLTGGQHGHALVVLERAACLELLRREQIGRLAVVADGQPHVVPLTYAADEDGVVVYRTGWDTVLTKADHERVAFEIDGLDASSRTGWSVCVHGFGREITHAIDEGIHRLRDLLPQPWAGGTRPRWFAVYPREITGRRLEARASADDESWCAGIPWS